MQRAVDREKIIIRDVGLGTCDGFNFICLEIEMQVLPPRFLYSLCIFSACYLSVMQQCAVLKYKTLKSKKDSSEWSCCSWCYNGPDSGLIWLKIVYMKWLIARKCLNIEIISLSRPNTSKTRAQDFDRPPHRLYELYPSKNHAITIPRHPVIKSDTASPGFYCCRPSWYPFIILNL